MTPEPVAATETKSNAKTIHCANVKPNKLRIFISLVGSESCTRRIREQAYYAALLQPEQDVVDGFARSAPNLCDRSGEWDRLETTSIARHSVGRGCAKRRTAFYHRRRRG